MRAMRIKLNILIITIIIILYSFHINAFGFNNSIVQNADFSNQYINDVLYEYMQSIGLHEGNFSLGYYNILTGEEYLYNPDKFMVAASLYKLPLCMAYTDHINAGEMFLDDKVGGYNLGYAIAQSIQYSNNDTALALKRAFGDSYHTEIAKYSGLDMSEFPSIYYSYNRLSSRFMLNTLKYLYENQSQYQSIIEYMKLANRGEYFDKAGIDYLVAQKYGVYHPEYNCSAIVYTNYPFLLVAFANEIGYAERGLAGLCELFTKYTEYTQWLYMYNLSNRLYTYLDTKYLNIENLTNPSN